MRRCDSAAVIQSIGGSARPGASGPGYGRSRRLDSASRGTSMPELGLNVKHDSGSKRIELQCTHQNGLLYVVPGEASWVCSEDLIHAHALAGFFRQLAELDDDRVKALMQRWGLYYRPRPLASEDDAAEDSG